MSIREVQFDWMDWVPHRNCWQGGTLPRSAGIYRIRRVGMECLDYVGQTGGGSSHLRARLSGHQAIYGEEMPYADPHTAAPGLWALRQEPNCEFEISVLSLHCIDSRRKAIEAFVISEHRQTYGHSPTINFSRMPLGWRKSSGVSTKLKNLGKEVRGGRCTELTPHHLPGIKPAGPLDPAIERQIWCNHQWSDWHPLDQLPTRVIGSRSGLYRIRGNGLSRLVYIGQGGVVSRLTSHLDSAKVGATAKGRSFAACGALEASWILDDQWSKNQREELENDLLAAHYLGTGEAPVAQFGGRDSIEEQR